MYKLPSICSPTLFALVFGKLLLQDVTACHEWEQQQQQQQQQQPPPPPLPPQHEVPQWDGSMAQAPPGWGQGGGKLWNPQMPPAPTEAPAPAPAPVGTLKAVPKQGDVGRTTVSGEDRRTGFKFDVGEDIFGPFPEGSNGMGQPAMVALGCKPSTTARVPGGIDLLTAEQMVAHECGIELPRFESDGPDGYVSLLDECGGRNSPSGYTFHGSMKCLWDGKSKEKGHSIKVGEGINGGFLYGKWENETGKVVPLLDACGAHFGVTPDSSGKPVYHYHVQDVPPFTFGCYGPNDAGSLVTVEECRALYEGCDGDLIEVETADGKKDYDPSCPCFDATGSNSGKSIAELPVILSPTQTKSLAGLAELHHDGLPQARQGAAWLSFAVPVGLVTFIALLVSVRRSRSTRSGAVLLEGQEESEDESRLGA